MFLSKFCAQNSYALGVSFRQKHNIKTNILFVAPVGMFFTTCLIIANLTAQKPIHFWFMSMPGGSLIFPFSYVFANILTEVYGYKWSRLLIWTSIICNTIALLYFSLIINMNGTAYWSVSNQNSFRFVLGAMPLVVLASSLSYLFGEHINSIVISKLKIMMKGKYLWLRAILSTTIGSMADSLVFIPLVFHNESIGSMLIMGGSLVLFKVMYEIVGLPLTYSVVYFLKGAENIDVYDYNTKYTPFSLELHYTKDEMNKKSNI